MTDFNEVIGKVSTMNFTNKARCLFYEIAADWYNADTKVWMLNAKLS